MGVPVSLDQPGLEQKLLHNRRGGFCFEHNTLFMRVLRDLDFVVRPYVAHSLWGHAADAERPLSHMVLVVDIAGTSYLVDVGFGGATLTAPLKLRNDVEQTTPNGVYRLSPVGEGFRLDMQLGEDWAPVYRFDLVEQTDADCARLSDTIAADHHARLLLIVSRVQPGMRTNLSGNRLTIHRPDQERERRILTSVEELRTLLSDTFGITLPDAELLDPALQKVLDAAIES